MIYRPSSYNRRESFFGSFILAAAAALLARSSSTALNNMMLSPPFFVKPNSIKAEWIVDQSSNNGAEHAFRITPPRSGHVGWVTPNTNDIYIFGGYAEEWIDPKTPKRYVKNDLWKCSSSSSSSSRDNNSISWIDMSSKQKGDVPQTRLASACSILTHDTYDNTNDTSASSLLLIGGWDPQTAGTGGVILDDIHELNLSTLQWTKLPIKLPDGPTSRHVAVTVCHCTYDTDEHDSPTKKPQQSILIHNHRCTDHVLLLSKQESDGEWQIRKQSTTGSPPSPRGLHVAQTFDSGSKVLIFGGAAQSGQMTNDAYVLDCNTWKWTQVNCGSLLDIADKNDNDTGMPSPRASPCLVTLHESSPATNSDGNYHHRFVLFGGAGRTPKGGLVDEGGLMGLNDTWLFHLVIDSPGDGDNTNNEGDAIITGWWEKLDTTSTELPPPGRNAATMFPLVSSTAGENASSYCWSFLLQGGWTPFVKTYNDNYILKISPSAK